MSDRKGNGSERNEIVTVNPKSVFINEIIEIKAGERVPLDGIMLNEIAAFNTAALTGECSTRYSQG